MLYYEYMCMYVSIYTEHIIYIIYIYIYVYTHMYIYIYIIMHTHVYILRGRGLKMGVSEGAASRKCRPRAGPVIAAFKHKTKHTQTKTRNGKT